MLIFIFIFTFNRYKPLFFLSHPIYLSYKQQVKMVINSAKVRNSFQGGQKTNRFIIGRRGRVGDESIVTETLILEVSLITFL